MTHTPTPSKRPYVYSVAASADGYVLHRDNKPFLTPAGKIFCVPSPRLADAIAKEWQAQGTKIDPKLMPLTQLATTTIDITASDRNAVADRIAAYAETELLCHRADEPDALRDRQQQIWQPLLDWLALHCGAPLHACSGIMPVQQPPEAVAAVRHILDTYDIFKLTGLHVAVESSGSLVLGLALAEGHKTPAEIFDAAETESLFQMEKWGEDPATLNRHATLRHELDVCATWFRFL